MGKFSKFHSIESDRKVQKWKQESCVILCARTNLKIEANISLCFTKAFLPISYPKLPNLIVPKRFSELNDCQEEFTSEQCYSDSFIKKWLNWAQCQESILVMSFKNRRASRSFGVFFIKRTWNESVLKWFICILSCFGSLCDEERQKETFKVPYSNLWLVIEMELYSWKFFVAVIQREKQNALR